jgi:hypothetical protein
MKQTAVEWFVEQFNSEEFIYRDRTNIIQQAKEMEKQQIIEAYSNGYRNGGDNYGYGNRISPEQYYNKTFKNE